MLQPTLVLSGCVALLGACAYGYVSRRLATRPGLAGGDARAMRCFAAWWGALALNLGLVAPVYLAGGLGFLPFPVQLASALLQRALLAASLVGLMGYLLYLLTGRTRLRLLAVIYGAYGAMLLGSLLYQGPEGVLTLAWRTDLAYQRPSPAWIQLASFLLIVLPPIASSVAYLRLLRRVATRTQRYRIVLVSASLLVWWIVAVLAGQQALLDHGPLQMAGRVLGVMSAIAVLWAFAPPSWLQRRLAVEAYPGSA